MPPLEEAACKAAIKARQYVRTSSHDIYPWLHIRKCEDVIEEVISAWLQDRTNLDRVTEQTRLRFEENPLNNVAEKYAIVWTQNWGKVERPFPGKHIVIIALDHLGADNGLPFSKDKDGNTVTHLNCGEFLVVSGDDTMILGNKGGGISLFIILNLSEHEA
ncbi:hypothetical protein ACJ73_09473 [Blastomyces percursus]|uniref:Uncharacterized protein n=1 Tax=Blastomyces percursus TaxID=1658174 RepID=A0A1J9P4Y2_9EURO|nr:hypothetical protein ACJ73_09473 [Blastomyces percursus]